MKKKNEFKAKLSSTDNLIPLGTHFKIAQSLRVGREWAGERLGVIGLRRKAKEVLPRAKVVSALRFARVVAIAVEQPPAETQQAGHTNGIN